MIALRRHFSVSPVARYSPLLDDETLDGAPEIAAFARKPGHGEAPAPSGPIPDSASAAHATNAAGAEPCCMLISRGPAALGLVTTRLRSTR